MDGQLALTALSPSVPSPASRQAAVMPDQGAVPKPAEPRRRLGAWLLRLVIGV